MSLHLVRPSMELETEYLAFEGEWVESGEEMTPYAAGRRGRSYVEWLEDTLALEREALPGWVTASTFLLVDEERQVLGAINIRHELNEYLREIGGHIGYGVRPSQRRKGYATAMLALALPLVRQLGLTRALVSCDKANTASAKTILRNGGVLEGEVLYQGELVQRYWIELPETPIASG